MIDETFTVNRRYVERFCKAIIDSGETFKWGAKTRIDLVDEDLIALMARAGLRKLGFGLESGVYDHRRRMRKNFDNPKVEEVFAACRRHGVESACTIIFGHPDETLDEMRQSVEFVKKIRAVYVEFHIMVLIPGTELFRRAVREGKVTEDVFERFMRGETGFPEYAPGTSRGRAQLLPASQLHHRHPHPRETTQRPAPVCPRSQVSREDDRHPPARMDGGTAPRLSST